MSQMVTESQGWSGVADSAPANVPAEPNGVGAANSADDIAARREFAPTSEPGAPRRVDEFNEFEYKPVSPLAPLALFLGVCSIVGLVGEYGLAVCVTGTLVGLVSVLQIRRSAGTLGGALLSWIGMGLSAGFLILGATYHTYAYVTERPDGFERLNFSWLAKQTPVFENGKLQFSPEVEALNGKPVFIKGYMLTTRQKENLRSFVLVKDTGDCCFGANPKLTDLVVVNFQDGMMVDHREQQLVGVAGIFRAKQVLQGDQTTALYSLEATYFK